MPEKKMVTIDSDITIPEGEEKIFENQHIQIGAEVAVSGSLIFKDCALEPYGEQIDDRPWYVYVRPTGKLEMDGCKIIHPRRSFLYGDNMTITNTSFVFEASPDVVISASKNCTFSGCSFWGEEGIGKSDNGSFRGSMSCRDAIMEGCTFQNINAAISIETLTDCSFTNCGRISGLCIASSTFINCASLQFIPLSFMGKGYVRNCDFDRVESVFCQKADVEDSRFQNLTNKGNYKGILYIDNCRASHCVFKDIELLNNSYLIYGGNNASVEDCEFTNCQTDREDSELSYIEPPKKIAKGLFKGFLKLAGTAALGAAGLAATVAREAGNATEIDIFANVAGMAQDASFEKIREIWGMDGTKEIDGMNLEQLGSYVDRLKQDMDDDDLDAFMEALHSIDGSELNDAEYLSQVKEVVKETVRERGKVKRTMKRSASAESEGRQFRNQYEKEKAKYEDDD